MGFSGKVLSEKGHAEEFFCGICTELVDLQEGVITSCHHVYCSPCLSEWLSRKKVCPLCQHDLGHSPDQVQYLRQGAPLAWRVLSRVKLQCPLGCGWEGDYSELQSHMLSASSHTAGEAGTSAARATAERLKEQANEKYAARNFPDALRLYSKAIGLCGDMAVLYGNRCVVLAALGQHAAALADCERAVALEPQTEKNWARGARCLRSLGRFRDAAAWLRRAPGAVSSPELRGALREADELAATLARCEQGCASGEWAAAREAAASLLQHCDAAAPVLLLAARAESEAGSVERALRMALQALRVEPANPAAYAERARAHLYGGETAEAEKYVKEALRRAPDDREAQALFRKVKRVRDALAGAADALARKEPAEAAQRCSDALDAGLPERSPARAALLGERANARFRQGELNEALRDCALCLYAQEDNRRGLLTRAYVLSALGRHDEAVRQLQSIMETWGSGDAVIRGAYDKAVFEDRKAKRPDYYNILSLPQSGDSALRPLSPVSSEMEIKTSYKAKALLVHPDKVAPQERARAEKEFKLMGEALETLTDPQRRKLYDEGFDKERIDEKIRRFAEQSHGHGHGHGHDGRH